MSRLLIVSLTTVSLAIAAEPVSDPIMGDWTQNDAPAVQVIALGAHEYRAHVFNSFASGQPPVAVLRGVRENGRVTFRGETAGTVIEHKDIKPEENSWWPAPAGSESWGATHVDGVFTLQQPGKNTAELKPIQRSSPTINAPPPAGAVVLLGPDTKDISQIWGKFKSGKDGIPGTANGPCPWTLEPGGVLRCVPNSGDIATLKTFGDCQLHLEFNLVFEPDNRSQNRSNSGIFFQERYELQVLDSYGLKGLFNETGALYREKAPMVNACLPPGIWQTYDVDFTAAKVDGQNITPAGFTVKLNGVTVQNGAKLFSCTGQRSKRKMTNDPGPFLLQDHRHAVAYRNIWVMETR